MQTTKLPAIRELPDWTQLRFQFTQTERMFLAETGTDGDWMDGKVCDFQDLHLSPAAAALHYGQAIFEGLKAQRTVEGKIVLFRPDENAQRFRRSAARLVMPPYPAQGFVRAVAKLVKAEERWVPPHGMGSLYIRPVMFGSGEVLGVNPAPSYTFFVMVSPVGPYKAEAEPKLLVMQAIHRAAPFGTGDIKAAGNYSGTLRSQKIAGNLGYGDVLYLDARHDRYIEEVGSSNFFAVWHDGTLVTPRLGSILPGITRDSVLKVANQLLGMSVVERELDIEDVLAHAKEVFITGTAITVKPITAIKYQNKEHKIGTGKPGPHTDKIRQRLFAIQMGEPPDPFGWVHAVDEYL